MVDFNKFRDPAWKAEFQAKEATRQAEQERKDKDLRAVLDVCREHYETLATNERSLVLSCHRRLNTYGVISEKQEAWLRSIAKRFASAQ